MNPRLIQLKPDAQPKAVSGELTLLGQWPSALKDERGRTLAFSLHPSSIPIDVERLRSIEGVSEVLGGMSPHPKVDALAHRVIEIAGHSFNQETPSTPLLISGPCSVESESAVFAAARIVTEAGGQWLRGGAFKPRTSPYSFQGVGDDALRWMRDAADSHGLKVITEALSERDVHAVAEWSDVVQIGTRNMQNFSLLKAVGSTGAPTLLKRGLCATVEEWLLAGEYLMKHGSESVIFCERGLRGFDTQTRNLLDLGAVALLKHTYGLPIIVDPSHAVGRRDLIEPLSMAALAVGADGVMVEAHPNAEQALSDGPQALDGTQLKALGRRLGLTGPSRSIDPDSSESADEARLIPSPAPHQPPLLGRSPYVTP